MSEADKPKGPEDEKPKESKEEKKERLKKEKGQKKEQAAEKKTEQKKERDKGKEPKADSKAEQKPDPKADKKAKAKGEAKADAKPKSDPKTDAKAKAKSEAAVKSKPDSKTEQKGKLADKAAIGTAEGQGGALEGEPSETNGGAAGAGEGEQEGEQVAMPEPPPKKPLPRNLLYGLIIVVFGVSIFLYTPLELFKIPDVLWFVPFVAVVMGLLRVWKKGLFDRWGQTLLVGGILSHFALLAWTDGSKWVPMITIPLMFVWAGFLVFAKGFQTWLKSRQPEEPVVVPEVPAKERKRWTYEDIAAVLAEAGETPDLAIPGELAATVAAAAENEPAEDAESPENEEEQK